MKIVYVTDALAICGGIERVITDKMNYLSEQKGHDVWLMTICQGPHIFPFVLNERIRHIDLNVRLNQQYDYNGIARLYMRWQLFKKAVREMQIAIENLRPDVLICVKLDFVNLLYRSKGSIPLVVESHTICGAEFIEGASLFHRLHLCAEKRYMRNVEAIVALTEKDANDWLKINSNVYVIPNIVHLNENSTYSNCLSKTVIYAGRLSKQKNIGELLDIWERTFFKNRDWRLHFYGDVGDIEKEIFDRLLSASEYGVIVHKPIKDNMIEEYKNHSILVLTSRFEPFGLVLPEAMSCGLPVVSYDSPYGPASIISDGIDGFLIKNNDKDTFVERLCQLMENEQLRLKMGKNAITSSLRYTKDAVMPMWKQLFEKLVTK